ncbi:spermatogenesis-associated protein 1 [Anoplopoma fimbria]|uniref:spermatogenesis-associated protein 1 n=1 Tax=Anoplopoma fimbria TaxID=229290 RepID=UPI0023EAC8A2|nr:spermatogenesis-associated protein 1 [Anoplopoma fimbria]XP_054458069.1 spermatogenesis-associated protein 1 [Anoplopoma fimbria]
MELSCESMRYPEDRRPASCKFVELHVLYVPEDQWNVKLNKVPAEAIESFISAGFIRVYPDINLKTLRSELRALLGAERNIDKFSFLKCVGRSLALVKSKQEKDLKVKTFAPPYAPQPELYLLTTVEMDSSVCSQSLTPDTSSSSPDYHTFYHPPKTCSLPAGTKEPVKFPLILQCSHQPPPTPSLEEGEEEEEEEEEDEKQSYSSSETEGENEEEGLTSNNLEWAEQECYPRKPHNQRATQLVSQNKGKTTAFQRCEANSAQVKELPEKRETCKKKKQYHRQNRAARDSGVTQSLEDRDSGFSLTDGLGKSKDVHALKSIRNKPTSGVSESPVGLSRCVGLTSPPPGRAFTVVTQKTTVSPVFQTNREELIEEIKLVKEERKQLEWTRQELLRKGKDLLAQNRHRRNQARDSWKKKYFETKKATAPLEENLRNLRQELETFYNKLLHQLQARDNRGKPRRQGRSSIKNELIIQIMTESHEIDNLKRKVEDAKMKLVTEIKLRKQAATELRALKAELAQKKSQSSYPGPRSSLGFGKTTRDGPQVKSTSI